MSPDDSEGPDTEIDNRLRQRVLEAIPPIDLDTASIYRRGRQLRTRRRLAVSAGALASVALIGVIAWTAAFRPSAPVPPAGTDEPESSQSASSSPSEETPDQSETPTGDRTAGDRDDGESTTSGPGDEVVLVPRIETTDLEGFATEHGLAVERVDAEENMVDVALSLQDGSSIIVTVTAARAEQTAQALEAATAGGDYDQSEVDEVVVHQQDQHAPGAPIHWLLVAGDAHTEFISIQANPSGQEADGNHVPTGTISLIEDELLSYMITLSNV